MKWISFIEALDQGDITKDDEIWNTNYIYCLNKLLLWKFRDDTYEQQRKQNEQKYK